MSKGKLDDLTGKEFYRLTVVERSGSNKRGCAMWLCKCTCGNFVIVSTRDLNRCGSRSCGCLKADVDREKMRVLATKHGKSSTTEHKAWRGLCERCSNSKLPCYPNYGGRGITVCDRWRYSFENFYIDMGPKPSPKHSLDRINNDGNYEPSNCRWATRSEQNKNRRPLPRNMDTGQISARATG